MTEFKTSIATEKLKQENRLALEAQARYEKALAKTVSRIDLIATAGLFRNMGVQVLQDAEQTLMDAIDMARDPSEVGIHYAMSDAAITLMKDFARDLTQANNGDEKLLKAFLRGAKPKPLQTVSQWAEKNRVLKSGTTKKGPWRNEANPHLVEIMDAFSVHSPVQQITFMKSSGVGGTEALYNMLGYAMGHVGNVDIMAVVPTLELRERSLNPRIDRLINETPSLSHIKNRVSRDSANRSDLLEYSPVGRLIKTGANSDEAARMDHVQYLLGDEVASWKSSKAEGDRVKLFMNRLRTATRGKVYFVSTPVRPDDAICREYEKGSQSRREVPCPHCGEYQELVLPDPKKPTPWGFKYALKDTGVEGEIEVEKAWYVCRHHGCIIEEPSKLEMLPKGKWVAKYPHRIKHFSMQLNALYINYGLGWSWVRIAKEYHEALTDTEAMQTFVNTSKGLPWEGDGEKVDHSPLMLRKRDYDDEPWLVMTGAVDVQKDRLELGIEGWLGHVKTFVDKKGNTISRVVEENWKITYLILPGDTAGDDVWDELELALAEWDLEIVLVDAGYRTDKVKAFCKGRKSVLAVKGFPGARPLVEDEKKRKQRLRMRRKKGEPIEPLGVDEGKAIIMSRLRNTVPGPGYVHFLDDPAFDEEYFLQIVSERLEEKRKGMTTWSEWEKIRERNEALDIANYNLAGIRLLNIDWEKRTKSKAAKVSQPTSRAASRSNGFAKEQWKF